MFYVREVEMKPQFAVVKVVYVTQSPRVDERLKIKCGGVRSREREREFKYMFQLNRFKDGEERFLLESPRRRMK